MVGRSIFKKSIMIQFSVYMHVFFCVDNPPSWLQVVWTDFFDVVASKKCCTVHVTH